MPQCWASEAHSLRATLTISAWSKQLLTAVPQWHHDLSTQKPLRTRRTHCAGNNLACFQKDFSIICSCSWTYPSTVLLSLALEVMCSRMFWPPVVITQDLCLPASTPVTFMTCLHVVTPQSCDNFLTLHKNNVANYLTACHSTVQCGKTNKLKVWRLSGSPSSPLQRKTHYKRRREWKKSLQGSLHKTKVQKTVMQQCSSSL